MMQAVVYEGVGKLHLVEVANPIPAANEVRLAVLLAGICSTDIHIAHGRFPVRPPRILGHELVGVVDAVGAEVTEDWLGTVCGVSPARFCGSCSACRRGLPELCLNFECIGNTHDGGFAEEVLVRSDQLVFLPEVKPEALVWLEPLACVLRALQTGRAAEANAVLIHGAGTLGRLMVSALAAMRTTHVAVVDPNQAKIDQAVSLGAEKGWVVSRDGETARTDEDIRDWTPEGAEVIIDTTGSPVGIERALRWSSPGGRIVLFGVPDPSAAIAVRQEVLFRKELTLQAVSGMTPTAFRSAVDLLQSGAIDPEILVSAVIGLDEVPAALQAPSRFGAGKILVQPGKGAA